MLVAEFRMWIFRILGYSYNLYFERFEFSLEPSEIGCFHSTTRCIILWIEIENCERRCWDETIEFLVHMMEDKEIFFVWISRLLHRHIELESFLPQEIYQWLLIWIFLGVGVVDYNDRWFTFLFLDQWWISSLVLILIVYFVIWYMYLGENFH